MTNSSTITNHTPLGSSLLNNNNQIYTAGYGGDFRRSKKGKMSLE